MITDSVLGIPARLSAVGPTERGFSVAVPRCAAAQALPALRGRPRGGPVSITD